jgi:hypothetical protein
VPLTGFAADYVATFNAAVASGDFSHLVGRFADDAVLRFDNVPPAGLTLEFAGRLAIAAAYRDQPPDDEIDLTGQPHDEDGELVIRFAWRRDRSPGEMRLTISDGLISSLAVAFG